MGRMYISGYQGLKAGENGRSLLSRSRLSVRSDEKENPFIPSYPQGISSSTAWIPKSVNAHLLVKPVYVLSYTLNNLQMT
jgi:hypothetical protein